MQHSSTPKNPVKIGLRGLANSVGLALMVIAVLLALAALWSVFHHG